MTMSNLACTQYREDTPRPERIPWWDNDERACIDDDRYTDLIGVPRKEREWMKLACTRCPVFYECLADLLSHPTWQHYGIQAGIEGKG